MAVLAGAVLAVVSRSVERKMVADKITFEEAIKKYYPNLDAKTDEEKKQIKDYIESAHLAD